MNTSKDAIPEDKSDLQISSVIEHDQDHAFSSKNYLKEAEEARVKRRKLTAQKKESEKPTNGSIDVASSDHTSFVEAEIISLDSGDESSTVPHQTISEPNVKSSSDISNAYQENIHLGSAICVDSNSSSSDSEVEKEPDLYRVFFPKSSGKGPRSQIRLLCDLSEPGNDANNVDTVSLSDLIGSADLLETYQFNFSVQLPLFLTFLHENFTKNDRKIHFITGDTVFDSPEMRDAVRSKFNISDARAPLPNRFASHHTKMMVNVFENGDAEVIIMTSNLTPLDICGLTQAVWRSGKLKKGPTTTTSGKRFRFDLLRYLARYGLSVTKKLISVVEKYDFSSVDVELVASAPGIHDVHVSTSNELYGYAKLRQVLERNGLLISATRLRHNILAQVTSIAYPYTSQKGHVSSVFSHILCPLMFENWRKDLSPGAQSFENHQKVFNYSPRLIFPTKSDVAKSNLGQVSGAALHFKYEDSTIHRAQYEQTIKKYLCKWATSGNVTGREKLTPHVKYYACDNGDDWQSLKWVMVGSHNLSKQAWGYPKPKTNGSKMDIASYELSVLIPQGARKLTPVYGADTLSDEKCTPVRFPFVVPPTPYEADDLPWCMD
ncbi:hypothetical protein OXX79_006694 [Metschnikowia pulcherrima]